ncbi:hypothetical protein MNBD_ALPHA11-851 [hydrothermal vent metagenome]|uniref:DUF4153 domain-containing protein n=1 Tax=hydrothermal vent metagenome TaxID=652676 RepID=A0A3B0U696_9ZZZZ
MKKFAEMVFRPGTNVSEVISRFPFAILLIVLSTLMFIGLINGFLDDASETIVRLAFGSGIGAVFSVAGSMFGQSITNDGKRAFVPGLIAIFLTYIMPLIAIGLLQIESYQLVVSYMLAPISVLWLSLSAFVYQAPSSEGAGSRVARSIDFQNRFWWLNHRAIVSAIIAGFGFLLIAAGFFAIQMSLSALFGLQTEELIYQYLLPFTGLFLTPVYWLATIPKLDDYQESEILNPDFLSRAIGFLGQYVMVPFLFLYSLILFAYGLQILVVGELPEGMISWMVLAFTTAGAATWLLLHPSFMHANVLVRYFRRFWFWLTIVPIILYFMAVSTRINAYGMTEDRIWLLVGGVWASLLAIAFLSKKFADIRLVPGLALILFIFVSVGPWNFINGPKILQAMRLENLIYNAVPLESSVGVYEWTDETAKAARGSYLYLIGDERSESRIGEILDRQGITYDKNDIDHNHVLNTLGLQNDEEAVANIIVREFSRQQETSVDLSQTPFLIGGMNLFLNRAQNIAGLSFELSENSILVDGGKDQKQNLNFTDWISQQRGDNITDPALDFVVNGRNFRLIVQKLNIRENSTTGEIESLTRIEALLFTDLALPDPN